MITSAAEVCDRILAKPKPLFFLDTCVILDVVRALHRESLNKDYFDYVSKLLKLYQEDAVWLVTAEIVITEYMDNILTVVTETEQSIRKMERGLSPLYSVLNSLAVDVPPPLNFSSYGLPSILKGVSEQVLNACLAVQEHEAQIMKARHRVTTNIAPASRGKNEYKDCEIIESFLDVSNKLRQAGFNEVIAFVTSNKSDYGDLGKLRSPLDTEFDGVKAHYVSNFMHALHIAKL